MTAPQKILYQLQCNYCIAEYVMNHRGTLRQPMNGHCFDTNHNNPDKPVALHVQTHNANLDSCLLRKCPYEAELTSFQTHGLTENLKAPTIEPGNSDNKTREFHGGRVENHFGKTNLNTHDQDSDLDLPVIGSLVYCENSMLENTRHQKEGECTFSVCCHGYNLNNQGDFCKCQRPVDCSAWRSSDDMMVAFQVCLGVAFIIALMALFIQCCRSCICTELRVRISQSILTSSEKVKPSKKTQTPSQIAAQRVSIISRPAERVIARLDPVRDPPPQYDDIQHIVLEKPPAYQEALADTSAQLCFKKVCWGKKELLATSTNQRCETHLIFEGRLQHTKTKRMTAMFPNSNHAVSSLSNDIQYRKELEEYKRPLYCGGSRCHGRQYCENGECTCFPNTYLDQRGRCKSCEDEGDSCESDTSCCKSEGLYCDSDTCRSSKRKMSVATLVVVGSTILVLISVIIMGFIAILVKCKSSAQPHQTSRSASLPTESVMAHVQSQTVVDSPPKYDDIQPAHRDKPPLYEDVTCITQKQSDVVAWDLAPPPYNTVGPNCGSGGVVNMMYCPDTRATAPSLESEKRRLEPAWSSQGANSRSNSLNSLQRFVLTRLRDRPPMYDDNTYIVLEKPPPYHVVMAENILSGAIPPWTNQQAPYIISNEGTTNAAFTAGNETNELSLPRNLTEEEHLHYLPHNTGNNSSHQLDRETTSSSALSGHLYDPRPKPLTIQSHVKECS
uniref:Uncharacterized protein n=1 Tax=Timema monikensis TaxID=170555 RepID=A0A7R9HQJ2_9NEOP|nr:unnamed protein product [Timema monikensis]